MVTYNDDDYFTSHSDAIIDLDYICVALLHFQKQELLAQEEICCLQLILNSDKKEFDMEDLWFEAERIKKHL